MSTFIRSALIAVAFLSAASALVIAMPRVGCDEFRPQQVSPAWPPPDFWDKLGVG